MLRWFKVSNHTVWSIQYLEFIKVRSDFGDQKNLVLKAFIFCISIQFLLKGDYNEMLDNRRVLRLGYE